MSISEEDYSDFERENENNFSEAEDIDFYAILNVPRNASTDDINRAYKQRSLIFHPDRHIGENDKLEASKIFVLLKRAHEALTDPQQRVIYDTLGIRGLNMQGWQLVSRSSNPENIRREYEFLRRLRDNELMLQRMHPASNFIIRSSIAGIFQKDAVETFDLLGMVLTHSIDCALTDAERIGLTGRVLFNEKGHGDGTAQIFYKRMIGGSAQIENYFTFGPKSVSDALKFAWTILPDSSLLRFMPGRMSNLLVGVTLILQPMVQYNVLQNDFTFSLIPALSFPLGFNNRGTIALNFGTRGLYSLTVTFERAELNHPKLLFQISISPMPSMRLAYHLRYPDHDNHYSAKCQLSFQETSASVSAERRFTKYSKIGIQLHFSWPSCLLQATFKIKTSLNNYEFRLLFCEQRDDIGRAMAGLAFTGLALSISSLVFRRFFPEFGTEKIGTEAIDVKKEQAQKIVHLMRETAEKIAREEERKKGLVILEAKFGQMSNDMPGAEHYPIPGEPLIDVTIPLQALVNDSQLRIYSGKDQIPGFYDPCPGESKVLQVIYRFQDRLHSVTVTEDQPLMLPMRAHSIAPQ